MPNTIELQETLIGPDDDEYTCLPETRDEHTCLPAEASNDTQSRGWKYATGTLIAVSVGLLVGLVVVATDNGSSPSPATVSAAHEVKSYETSRARAKQFPKYNSWGTKSGDDYDMRGAETIPETICPEIPEPTNLPPGDRHVPNLAVLQRHLHYLEQNPEVLQGSERLVTDGVGCPKDQICVGGKPIPKRKDWREYRDPMNPSGIVTPVKDQGACGSCYSFSAAETVESAWAKEHGVLNQISNYQVMTCEYDTNPLQCGGTGGCNGGAMVQSFDAYRFAGLALVDAALPYPNRAYLSGQSGRCEISCNASLAGQKNLSTDEMWCTSLRTNMGAIVESVHALPANDYKALMRAVATVGPISIAVDALNWWNYTGGVFDDCNKTLDHGVQLMGYGTDNVTSEDYWLVRNSWGTGFGENGYIRLKRSPDDDCATDHHWRQGLGCKDGPTQVEVCGTCGILRAPSYVKVLSRSADIPRKHVVYFPGDSKNNYSYRPVEAWWPGAHSHFPEPIAAPVRSGADPSRSELPDE